MHSIPMPQLLDPDRPLANDRDTFTTKDEDKPRAELLDKALHETCAYAGQLWENLDAARQYLLESLPPDPQTPGPSTMPFASPAGPDDDAGWERWIAAYASVTSVLCGPHGDSGFGLREALGTAQQRRTAVNVGVSEDHSQPRHENAASAPRGTPPNGRMRESSVSSGNGPTAASAASSEGRTALRATLAAVMVVLALRGLRPRRSRTL